MLSKKNTKNVSVVLIFKITQVSLFINKLISLYQKHLPNPKENSKVNKVLAQKAITYSIPLTTSHIEHIDKDFQ